MELWIQLPKPANKGTGHLSVDRAGAALFFDHEDRIVSDMVKVGIVHASSKGIMLSGMEPAGVDCAGRLKYTYQEWWIIYEK